MNPRIVFAKPQKQERTSDTKGTNEAHKEHKELVLILVCAFVGFVCAFCGELICADHFADAGLLFCSYLRGCFLRVTPIVEDADLVDAL